MLPEAEQRLRGELDRLGVEMQQKKQISNVIGPA